MRFSNKIFGLTLVFSAALLVLAAVVSAFFFPPVVTIGASPNVTEIQSTVVAVASDLSGEGIDWIKIYEDGANVKTCYSIGSCVYSAVHLTEGNRSYYAIATDMAGRASMSNTVYVYFSGDVDPLLNSPPVLDFIGDQVVYVGSLLEFTISATDPDGDVLTYSSTGVPAGASFDALTQTFSWTPVIGDLGDHLVTFSVSDGLFSDSETITVSVIEAPYVDNEAPRYYSIVESPANGSAYVPGQVYEFNITWTDNVGVTDVWAEFNGESVSVVSNGDVYSFSVSDLGAGEHIYVWSASDALGNTNTTGVLSYVVEKAVPSLGIDMLPSAIVSSDTETNVSGTGCPSVLVCELFRDGVNVSDPDVSTLADGTYIYEYNTTGNGNYTSASVSEILRVGVSGGGGNGETNDTEIIEITDSELTAGHYEWMRVGDKLKFHYCGTPYYIKLTDIDDDDDDERAYFRLNPRGWTFSLEEDDREELDVDYDGSADILFKAEKISSERVKIYIKRISDVCPGMGRTNLTNLNWHGIDSLGGEEEREVPLYMILFLLFGILLALLAILMAVARKKRR